VVGNIVGDKSGFTGKASNVYKCDIKMKKFKLTYAVAFLLLVLNCTLNVQAQHASAYKDKSLTLEFLNYKAKFRKSNIIHLQFENESHQVAYYHIGLQLKLNNRWETVLGDITNHNSMIVSIQQLRPHRSKTYKFQYLKKSKDNLNNYLARFIVYYSFGGPINKQMLSSRTFLFTN
jgi:hypothetical protein